MSSTETGVGAAERAAQRSQEQSHTPPLFTESPEFKAAVAAAASDAVKEILADLERNGLAGAKQSTEQTNFAEGLAMAIAQLNDQGTGRKRVAPEILEARNKARERMVSLITLARAEGKLPVYHLRHKVFLDEQLVEPIWIDPQTKSQRPTEIGWPGVPNEAMIPQNEVACAIHAAFMDSIGSLDPKHRIKEEPLFTTAGGLVISGKPTASRELRNRMLGDAGAPLARGEGLSIGHKGVAGSYRETHVLGTLAAPAQQTV